MSAKRNRKVNKVEPQAAPVRQRKAPRNITLSEDVFKTARVHAFENGMSLSGFIEKCLRDELRQIVANKPQATLKKS